MIAVGGKAFRWSDYRYRVVSLEIMKKIDVGRLFDYSAGLTRCAGYPSIWNRLASELTPGVSVEAVLREPDVKRKYVDYLSGIGAACLDADLARSDVSPNRDSRCQALRTALGAVARCNRPFSFLPKRRGGSLQMPCAGSLHGRSLPPDEGPGARPSSYR